MSKNTSDEESAHFILLITFLPKPFFENIFQSRA